MNLVVVFTFLISVGLVSAGLANGTSCNADLTNLIEGDNCTISTSLTLNGTYTRFLNWSGDASLYQGIIRINGSDLTFDCNNSILVGNFTDTLITSNNQDNVTIRNCNIYNYTYGSWLDVMNNTIVRDNYIENTGNGIRLQRSGFSTIFNNTIFRNYSFASATGIRMYNNRFMTDIENNISGNNISFHYNGITCLTNCSNNFIHDNTFYNNSGHHIAVSYNSSYNQVFNNRMIYGANPTAFNGIRITGNYNNITNNTIQEQTHVGIDLFNCEAEARTSTVGFNRVVNNTISNMHQGGHMQICNISNNYISGNVINNFTGNTGIVHGIYILRNSENNVIINNTFLGNILSDAISLLFNASNNIIRDTNLNSTNGRYDLRDDNNNNNTFTNVLGRSLLNISLSNNSLADLFISDLVNTHYIRNYNTVESSLVRIYNLSSTDTYTGTISSPSTITSTQSNITLRPGHEVTITQ